MAQMVQSGREAGRFSPLPPFGSTQALPGLDEARTPGRATCSIQPTDQCPPHPETLADTPTITSE